MKKILTFKRNNDKLNVLTNMDNMRPIWKIYDQFGQFNPIPTSKKSYIKDHPRAESALVYMKSNLVLSLYYSDVPGGVVVSTMDL